MTITQQDQDALNQLIGSTFVQAIANNPDLSSYLQNRLMPPPGEILTQEQRDLLALILLKEPVVANAEAIAGGGNGFTFSWRLDTAGNAYIISDLLLDCNDPTDNYYWAKDYLQNLEIVSSDGIEWQELEVPL